MTALKIVRVHNYYPQRAGEDFVADAEKTLLESAGCEVVDFVRDSAEVEAYSALQKARLGVQTVWSQAAHRDLRVLLERVKPDLAHFTNLFPMISPSAYFACQSAAVPVVQSVHNYRLICPSAKLMRSGRVCEECVQHSLLRSVRYGCYADSRPMSAVVATMLATHRTLGTYRKRVDCYIALLEFGRQKLIEGGLPADRIVVKPNFLDPDPGPGRGEGGDVLFVGRISKEKGLKTLLKAWSDVQHQVRLRIAGSGPELESCRQFCAQAGLQNVDFLGALSREQVLAEMKSARMLVFPSEWYEGYPLTLVEAFACATPVLASRLGAMQEMIRDGETGILFEPADADSLAERINWALSHGSEMQTMGQAGRQEFERHHTAQANRARMLEIFEQVIERRRAEDAAA